MLEKGSRHSPHLSSTGTSRGSPHSGRLSGLLPDHYPQAAPASAGRRLNSQGRSGNPGCDSNAGCPLPHHRWPLLTDAPLHRTGGPTSPAFTSTPPHVAQAARSTNQCSIACCPTQNVVQTFVSPLLNLKDFPLLNASNCERSVRRLVRECSSCRRFSFAELFQLLQRSPPGLVDLTGFRSALPGQRVQLGGNRRRRKTSEQTPKRPGQVVLQGRPVEVVQICRHGEKICFYGLVAGHVRLQFPQ